jgi:hypothetical protein
MSKTFKIISIGLFGFFFSIATLEIDVFGYDNTFFDSYDSYIQVDNQVLNPDTKADLDSFTFPEVTPSPFFDSALLLFEYEASSLPPFRYKRKLYIVQSSLLI